MRRLSFAPCARSVVAAEGRASSVLIRGYSATTLHSAVEVNEDLSVFKESYQKALKKFGAKEGSDLAEHLKTLTKSKVVGLEGIKVQHPQEYDNFVKAVEEIEELAINYTPEIRPTVDEAFDSKDHPFITDPIGAEIFQIASDLIDKQNHLSSVFNQRLGLTPRKKAELLWKQVEEGVLDQEYDPPEERSRGDLPDWVARALDGIQSLKKLNSKKELLDYAFSPVPFEFSSPAIRKALAGEKKEAIALTVAKVAADEGFEPGTPEYAEIQLRLAKLDPVPIAGTAELQKSADETNQKLTQMRGKFEELLTPEPKVFNEEVVNVLRYTGENGVARRAVSGFLLANPEPNDDDKLKFMKTLRDAIRQRRRNHGFVLRELYPALSLPVERNVDDNGLVAKFNELAASL